MAACVTVQNIRLVCRDIPVNREPFLDIFAPRYLQLDPEKLMQVQEDAYYKQVFVKVVVHQVDQLPLTLIS